VLVGWFQYIDIYLDISDLKYPREGGGDRVVTVIRIYLSP